MIIFRSEQLELILHTSRVVQRWAKCTHWTVKSASHWEVSDDIAIRGALFICTHGIVRLLSAINCWEVSDITIRDALFICTHWIVRRTDHHVCFVIITCKQIRKPILQICWLSVYIYISLVETRIWNRQGNSQNRQKNWKINFPVGRPTGKYRKK